LSTTCPEGMAQTNRREFPPEPPKWNLNSDHRPIGY
jgi:hypothetical protein